MQLHDLRDGGNLPSTASHHPRCHAFSAITLTPLLSAQYIRSYVALNAGFRGPASKSRQFVGRGLNGLQGEHNARLDEVDADNGKAQKIGQRPSCCRFPSTRGPEIISSTGLTPFAPEPVGRCATAFSCPASSDTSVPLPRQPAGFVAAPTRLGGARKASSAPGRCSGRHGGRLGACDRVLADPHFDLFGPSKSQDA